MFSNVQVLESTKHVSDIIGHHPMLCLIFIETCISNFNDCRIETSEQTTNIHTHIRIQKHANANLQKYLINCFTAVHFFAHCKQDPSRECKSMLQ